jgi:hypothetical protein
MNMSRKEAIERLMQRIADCNVLIDACSHNDPDRKQYIRDRDEFMYLLSMLESLDQPSSDEQIARECEAARDAADKIWTLKLWLLPDSELPAHQAADLILEAMRRKVK